MSGTSGKMKGSVGKSHREKEREQECLSNTPSLHEKTGTLINSLTLAFNYHRVGEGHRDPLPFYE